MSANEIGRRRPRKPLLAASGLVKIYPGRTRFRSKGKLRRYQTHLLVYHDAAGRHRERRASLDDAKARAEQIGRDILNGHAAMAQFSEADRAAYAAGIENCKRAGLDLVSATAQLAAAFDRIRKSDAAAAPTIDGLVTAWLQSRPRGITPLSLPKLVAEFLKQRRAENSAGNGWLTHLEHHVAAFADHFAPDPGAAPPMHLLDAKDINAWLRALKGKDGNPLGLRSRHNYRAAVEQLARWAQSNGYLPRDWSEMSHVADPGARPGETKILAPDQLARLLNVRRAAEETGKAKRSLVPFLALQAWAGVRHEEINGEKALLDWRNIDLDHRALYVPKDVAKTGRDRVVPICDTLAAWLAPYAKRSGPITDLAETANALTAAKRRAGIPAGKNELRNALRKSFISYRLVVTKDIARVALEAGNSPSIIKKHYLRFCPMDGSKGNPFEEEAKRWFGIWPQSADVIQLSLALK